MLFGTTPLSEQCLIREELIPRSGLACKLSMTASPMQALTPCFDSFLNDVKRIASKDYQPSDDDVVRARLRTMGVQEHRFVFEKGKGCTSLFVNSHSMTI